MDTNSRKLECFTSWKTNQRTKENNVKKTKYKWKIVNGMKKWGKMLEQRVVGTSSGTSMSKILNKPMKDGWLGKNK